MAHLRLKIRGKQRNELGATCKVPEKGPTRLRAGNCPCPVWSRLMDQFINRRGTEETPHADKKRSYGKLGRRRNVGNNASVSSHTRVQNGKRNTVQGESKSANVVPKTYITRRAPVRGGTATVGSKTDLKA